MPLSFYSDHVMLSHEPGGPERPERLAAIYDVLDDANIGPPRPFDRAVVERVHDPDYVDRILALQGEARRIDADTATSAGTVEAIRAAVGCSVAVADDVVQGRPAWALVRPPGHHAGIRSAAGFCFFDNIAVATEAVLSQGAERVLIVDWDVHHGNGTQEIFWERGDVFYFSTHQWPLYPGTGSADETGAGEGAGATLNVPMPPGCGDDEYLQVYREVLPQTAREFGPDAILVSAGFDAHRRDPLASMDVTARGFGEIATIVADLADELCDGRLGLFLEGGYDLEALADSVRACVDAIGG